MVRVLFESWSCTLLDPLFSVMRTVKPDLLHSSIDNGVLLQNK